MVETLSQYGYSDRLKTKGPVESFKMSILLSWYLFGLVDIGDIFTE